MIYLYCEIHKQISNQNKVLHKNGSLPWDFPGGTVVKNPPANAEDRVRALFREDPTCHRATKPVCHNY